jgi:hypothetical protein
VARDSVVVAASYRRVTVVTDETETDWVLVAGTDSVAARRLAALPW